METKNKELADKNKNLKHYSKSDGNFMPLDKALMAHVYIDRVSWVREWIHKIDSRNHLDVGCKDGYLCLELSAEGLDCRGIDPSQDAIEEANLKASEADLSVEFSVSTIEEFAAVEKEYDSVTCMEVLEHVIDPGEVIRKLCSLGKFIMITTPDANGRHGMIDSERNKEHLRLYTQKELEGLIKEYGEIDESVIRDDQLCIAFRPN